MATTPSTSFHYEVEQTKDENDFTVTVVKCKGRLVSENAEELRKVVQPLIQRGGRIALDFGELEYVDSRGLGAIVGLKVSAINKGLCVLMLRNLTPRVKQLMSITNILEMFSS
jgi:anti-anti-sigma factor